MQGNTSLTARVGLVSLGSPCPCTGEYKLPELTPNFQVQYDAIGILGSQTPNPACTCHSFHTSNPLSYHLSLSARPDLADKLRGCAPSYSERVYDDGRSPEEISARQQTRFTTVFRDACARMRNRVERDRLGNSRGNSDEVEIRGKTGSKLSTSISLRLSLSSFSSLFLSLLPPPPRIHTHTTSQFRMKRNRAKDANGRLPVHEWLFVHVDYHAFISNRTSLSSSSVHEWE